jgi:nitrite reductase (NADH) large subunit
MRDKDEIVCHCQEVTYQEIVDAFNSGADTIDKIGDVTEAGTACGGCIEDIEEILEELTK